MTTRLYRWPSPARFGRVVPKSKFYEHANVSASLKSRFVSDIHRITWAYKLAESTVNLSGSSVVPEIQVFEVRAKEDDVAEGVLAAVDKAVRTPIIFEIERGQGAEATVRMVAAHKQIGTGAPKLGPYFSTEWEPVARGRVPLPAAVDLTSLYTALLQPLTPVAPRAGENVSDVVGRLTTVDALEREIASLKRKLRNEPQLNRKVELRRTLKIKQATLVEMTSAPNSPAPSNRN